MTVKGLRNHPNSRRNFVMLLICENSLPIMKARRYDVNLGWWAMKSLCFRLLALNPQAKWWRNGRWCCEMFLSPVWWVDCHSSSLAGLWSRYSNFRLRLQLWASNFLAPAAAPTSWDFSFRLWLQNNLVQKTGKNIVLFV